MSKHRSHAKPAQKRQRSGRTRAVLSLGAVAVLATGMSVKGTFAFWTDSAVASTGTFTSGTLDIKLADVLAGQGGTTTISALTLTQMVPGESVAASFPVANNGTVGLTYTISGTATGDLAPQMQFTVFSGTAQTPSGTAANGNRTGSCSGTVLASNVVLGTTSQPVVSTARPLTASGTTGASENICVVARLNPAADNAAQNKQVSASLLFDAKQVGA